MGRYRLDAMNADEHLADHLQVPVNKALFLIERLSIGAKEKPIYFQRRFYRTDRVKYEVELARDKHEPGKNSSTMPLREFAPVFKKALMKYNHINSDELMRSVSGFCVSGFGLFLTVKWTLLFNTKRETRNPKPTK